MKRRLPLLSVGLVLGSWELAARLGWLSPLFFPAPSQVMGELARLGLNGSLWPGLALSLYRLLVGTLIGALAGLSLGLGMGMLRPLRLAFDPLIAALHPLPKLAIFPIFLVLLGIGENSKIAIIALTAFFPMLLNTLSGVQQIDRFYWDVARSYGAGNGLLLRRVILPGSLPFALTGLRLGVNSALIVTIAVEMLAANSGLGALIWISWQTMRIRQLYAALVVIAMLGLGLNSWIAAAARRLAPWQNYDTKETEEEN